MKTALERVIDIHKTQTALAQSIGTGQATVAAWVNRFGGKVGAEFVIAVSKSVNFVVTPHQLRPDLYPHPHDGLPEHLRQVA